MFNKVSFFIVGMIACCGACAEEAELNNALRTTYVNCVGIDDALHDMKVRAGINTAVTGVGTGLGAGAVATGVAKARIDKDLEQKYKTIEGWAYGASGHTQVADRQDWLMTFTNSLKGNDVDNSKAKKAQEILELEKKSKKLGDWRTGLLAGNTATNVAGAVIAGTNKVNKTLEEQIDDCKLSVKDLKNAIARAKFNGEDTSEAKEIADACGEFEYVDISKINNRATGSMASSIVGAGTGVVGTITSALANSNKIRNDDSERGQQKEKNLNASANVLAVGSTVASATATVFNATQIKAIKDVAKVASQCTEVLK